MREQFEKENPFWTTERRHELPKDYYKEYSQWLEAKNKELEESKEIALKVMPEWSDKITELEEQNKGLKSKSDEVHEDYWKARDFIISKGLDDEFTKLKK